MKEWADPPSGWRYGFPKIYDRYEHPNFAKWLLDNGYPQKDLELALNYSRFWTANESSN
jgi:hypothetical protein